MIEAMKEQVEAAASHAMDGQLDSIKLGQSAQQGKVHRQCTGKMLV